MQWSVEGRSWRRKLVDSTIIISSLVGLIAPGLVARWMFFPDGFVWSVIFSSLQNAMLFLGMILLALVLTWFIDTHNELFLLFVALSFTAAFILLPCTYTGEFSRLLDIPLPISISFISIPVLVSYFVLLLILHLVWEDYCFEYITVFLLLYASIFTQNTILSLFTLAFSLTTTATVRGTCRFCGPTVMIFRFGKPVRKRKLTFFVLPFIEEYRPYLEEKEAKSSLQDRQH